MSSIANLVVYDGAATPVLHTFLPKGVKVQGDLFTALWYEPLASVPVYACPRASLTQQKLKSAMTRTSMRFEIPVMESVAGANASGYTAAPKVAYVTVGELTMYSHERSTKTDRTLVRMLPVNSGNNIIISVAASSGGPVVEAMDSQVMPT